MKFGDKLLTERKKLHITAATLAQKCGISRSYITLMENNHRLPGRKIIPKIAIALNLKTVDVLNWYLQDVGNRMKEDFESN